MGNIITGAAFAELKTRVKAECARRNVADGGSVESYAGTAYDYVVPAEAGNIIKQEHFKKINEPLSAINSNEINYLDPDRTVAETEFVAMSTQVADLATKAKSATSLEDTGCKESCTGLCFTTCTGGCYRGCSGCGSGCSYGCDGGCTGSCEGGCTGGCDGICKKTCTSICTSRCSYACGEYCYGDCATNCTSNCHTDCEDGCGGSCTGTCDQGCYGHCASGCTANCASDCTASGDNGN